MPANSRWDLIQAFKVVNIDLQTRKKVKMRKKRCLIYNKDFFKRQDGGLRGNHFAEASGLASSEAFIMYLRSLMGMPCFATADTHTRHCYIPERFDSEWTKDTYRHKTLLYPRTFRFRVD